MADPSSLTPDPNPEKQKDQAGNVLPAADLSWETYSLFQCAAFLIANVEANLNNHAAYKAVKEAKNMIAGISFALTNRPDIEAARKVWGEKAVADIQRKIGKYGEGKGLTVRA